MLSLVYSRMFRLSPATIIVSGLLVSLLGCAGPKRGILVMAHGGDADWNRDVEAVVEPLRARYATEIAFGMAQTSSIREAVAKLEAKGAREIAVIRLFVSGDSFVPATEYILGLRPDPPADPLASRGTDSSHPKSAPSAALAHHWSGSANDQHVVHTAEDGHGGHCMEPPEPIHSNSRFVMSHDGVGASPLIDEILLDRVRTLSTDPVGESVLVLAHGPADDVENERWLANMNDRVQALHSIGTFREVRCETLREDWPEKRRAAENRIREFVHDANRDGGRCIVIPFRIAGFGEYDKVLTDLTYVADGRGFCPHPNMTKWIDETARRCFATP